MADSRKESEKKKSSIALRLPSKLLKERKILGYPPRFDYGERSDLIKILVPVELEKKG